ncbi:MAG: ParB/RepB/Spo0J family partition protein [Candidatus Aminicenantes bacterium]|nr:ParB/RepB/Spo0J family partition protein [Candidatus Aminicenantes bacterium]
MKKALGRGIQAFIPEEYGILREERLVEVEVDRLSPSPLQPRMKFDQQAIDELAQSIRETGILQPIVAVPEDGGYRILIGERRWRAARKAGLHKVPVLVRNIPKEQQLEVTLIENLQREELNPVEIARSFKRLVDELGYTQEEIADRVGKDRASVANYLRLLKLPPEILDFLGEERISMGHARALLSLEDPKVQVEAARKIVKSDLTVREVEDFAARQKKPVLRRKAKLDPDLEAVQEDLIRRYGTKVAISGTAKKGEVKFYYFSLDELNRLYDLFKGARS